MNLDSNTYVYPYATYQKHYDGLGVIGRHYFVSDNITTFFLDASYNASHANQQHLIDGLLTMISCWPGKSTIRLYVFT